MQPKHNILLIAFTAEEIELKGSQFFIDNPIVEPEHIVLHINMDMVGHLNPKELKAKELYLLAFDSIASITKTFLLKNEKLGVLQLSLSSELPERINFMLNSADNKPFLELGVRSLLFTDGPFVEFHSFKDTPEVLDLGKMSALSELIFEVLMNHAFIIN